MCLKELVLVDEIIPNYFNVNLNKTYDDEFLNNLCSDVVDNDDEDMEESLFNPTLNVDLH